MNDQIAGNQISGNQMSGSQPINQAPNPISDASTNPLQTTQDDVFDYNCIRAAEARLGNTLNHPVVAFLTYVVDFTALGGAVALFILKSSMAWLCLGISVCATMLILWMKLSLKKVPSGKTDSINDILSANALAHLPKNPTPLDLANVMPHTRSGRFLAVRYGITLDLLQTIAKMLGNDPTPVFAKAREIRKRTGSRQISGGILAIAVLETFPDSENLLAAMRLDQKDIEGGIVWYNYLYGLVEDSKRRRRDGGIARDFSFGYIPILSRFGRNISETKSANSKTQVRIASAPEVLKQMFETFSKSGRQNVALIGPDGSGRTTIVHVFAEELLDADTKIPRNLKYRQVFKLDASAIISAASNRGQIEQLVNAILSEAFAAKNIILFLKDAHLFFEEDVGSVDISNLLIPVLEAGQLRMILTLDQQKYLEIAAKKPNLANALNKIMISPASEKDTMEVLEDRVPMFEYQHHVVYTIWALKEAYRLSERYIHDLVMPGRAINLLEAAAKYADQNGFVTAESVQMAIERTEGVKVKVADTSEDRNKLLNLEDLIHERMIDQKYAVKTVSDALRRAAAGVRNQNKPIGTFLFLGPTGVGKTELAKAISDVYFGGESEIIRIDLNEYVSASDVNRLLAEATDDPSSLAAQVMKKPFSVVLLDEIEKAHQSVLTTLLQLLDEGILRDVKNREVSFRDTIVVATSNAGVHLIRDAIARGEELTKEELTNELIKSGEFKPEFLNRFDEICIFKPLEKEDLKKIVDLLIKGVNKTLSPQKITIALNEDAKELLVDKGYDPQLGARPMRRIVQKTVENLVAKAVLSGTAGSGANILITKEMIESEL